LRWKEVGGLLVIILQFKIEKHEQKQKEYNLRYLLAKVRITRGKAQGTGK
jgi:hypothetical protein